MKWLSLVSVSTLALLSSACALPWASNDPPSDSSGSSSGEGADSDTKDPVSTDSDGTTTETVSSEVKALCEKLAPVGCVTACKQTGTCFDKSVSTILSIECDSYAVTFRPNFEETSTYCSLSKIIPDNAADKKLIAARKRMFVTSQSWNGDLKTAGKGSDGLTGADNLCSQAAAAADIGGTWKAWVSSSTGDAASRLTSAKGWYDLSRDYLLFANVANLGTSIRIDGQLTDETGASSVSELAWSGGDGKYTCADWSDSVTTAGWVKQSEDFAEYDTNPAVATKSCDKTNHLFCFEQ